jgi:hypothetical protein
MVRETDPGVALRRPILDADFARGSAGEVRSCFVTHHAGCPDVTFGSGSRAYATRVVLAAASHDESQQTDGYEPDFRFSDHDDLTFRYRRKHIRNGPRQAAPRENKFFYRASE